MPMEKLLHRLLSAMILLKVSDATKDPLSFDNEIRNLIPLDERPLDGRHPDYTKTLFLDLDETLVYTHGPNEHYDGPGAFNFRNEENLVGQLREGVIETLQALVEDRWELIIWTAGRNWYGQSIAKYLKGRGVVIAHVIGRERSGRRRKQKDLTRLISNTRQLESMFIVDNISKNCYPEKNTIEINSWYGYARSGADGGAEMRELKVVLHELKRRIDGEPIPAMRGESSESLNFRDEPSAARRLWRHLVSSKRWPRCLCGQEAE